MSTRFAAELPEEPPKPSKLPLTKRLKQKLTPQRVKQKHSAHTASQHVLTRHTSPSPTTLRALMESRTRQEEARNSGSVQARTRHAVPSLTSKARDDSDSTLTCQPSLLQCGHSHFRPEPPSIDKKEVQGCLAHLTVKDPLVERFEKLRLPVGQEQTETVALAASLSSRSTTNFSLPLPSHNSTAAAKLAWNKMAISNPLLPSFKEQPRSYRSLPNTSPHQRTSQSTSPIIINDDSDEDVTLVCERPKGNFSNTNFFQSSGRSRQSSYQQQSRINKTSQKKSFRPNRSPSTSSSDSQGELTPSSSEDSHIGLTARRGSARATTSACCLGHCDGKDHDQSTQPMQQRKDETCQSIFCKRLGTATRRSSMSPRSSPNSSALSPHRNTARISCLRRAPTQSGTREDPISLDSDPEDSSDVNGEPTARIRDVYRALYGEPMEIDDVDQTEQQGAKHSELPQTTENLSHPAALPSRDCAVCGDNVHIVVLPSLPNCSHRPETCTNCYSGWITAQLQGNGWSEVKCPAEKCRTTLSYHEIWQYADPETFRQYDTFIARAAISKDPNFRWCRACDSGQIHVSGVEGNIFTCAACGHKICILHENTWHQGETCEEFEYRASGRKGRDQKAQEAASLQVIGKLTKKCPGPECVYNIEKNDGCDHMTCSKCRYEFCWICLCDYSKVRRVGNAAHSSSCKYHTTRLG
ncbi:hypothetical protein BDW02DRAFT_333209 [Decorospora gaudefroyi]|uniref:RBR-type E3 ubiquitin transferase n=1 Tax=Decorospora gaudefroyi TaxID=184978 RepID=A0A6A5KDW8_9PLEO|nr:hypothetical protein BDW02DRAFT_333209 [Decorospora gaudefroyi]